MTSAKDCNEVQSTVVHLWKMKKTQQRTRNLFHDMQEVGINTSAENHSIG